jgi:hypothetical protein
MRKLMTILVLSSSCVLPGCILAFGGGDAREHDRERVRSLEKRVAAIEKHCQEACGENCKLHSED